MIYVMYHSCTVLMTTFLFNEDDSPKHNFTTLVISQPLCIFFSSFLCFSLAQENVQSCGGLRLRSGGCFPIILLLPSSKKAIYVSLAPFCLGCLSQELLPNNPPTSSAETTVCHYHFGVKSHTSGSKQQKTPKLPPSLAPNFFPPSAPWLHREHSHFSPCWSSSG